MKRFKCLGCGAHITTTSGNPGQLVDSSGRRIGCAQCGSLDYAPILKQLLPENDEIDPDD